ncbi:excalibur calcium-binding domain-containing protein [Microbacterium sp. p3-SID338]|uniref:GmrSD restriction endonuclease domain-containing protein n=1 Tax=Microbacterium sp. p3-SID338 TaxID=2916214 RepID=UPI0021A83FCC|nr:DUF1524 domain-containing protein [Microbacterium sp. p3-SID338]MCT1394675.1 excalibur calcium-binding domain-containing protein [Microbacterium sp. p3-SID338]
MSTPPAGWFPDPENPKQTRWWDGEQWTAQTAPPPPTGLLPPPARSFSTAAVKRKIPAWLWIVGGLVAVLATVFLSPLVALIALIVAITGVVALVRNTPTWLRFTSRKRAVFWTVASAVVFFVVGSISTAIYPTDESTAGEAPPEVIATPTASPTTSPSATPFADDAAEVQAFAGLAGTAKDASATANQTALAVLATLEVKGRAPKTGYDRDEFGQRWLDVDRNGCDTRNDILARDLTDITRSGPCRVTSGSLLDPFTGTDMQFVRGQGTSELVQVDHVVSLSDAWQKGAQQLTADQRATFANDPLNLLTVDGAANAQKGDGDAATWLPGNRAFRCTYVARQVAVKATYGLWVTQAEHDAIARVLSACPDEPAPASAFAAPAPSPTPEAAPVVQDPVPAPPAPAPVQPAPVEPAPAPPVNTFYANCDAVRAAGASPLYAGSPGYSRKQDRDGDGVACE